jgi:predicted secreted hydrolase
VTRPPVIMLVAALVLGACERTSSPPGNSDFAVLAKAAEGYAQARPGRPLAFPRDHGAHPDFRIEWWYLTANLKGADGQDYGAQWTLFRSAVRPPGSLETENPWQSEQVFMAHFALTSPDGHQAFQRYARGGVHGGEARAGAVAEPFAVWLDDWTLTSSGPEWLPLEVRATQDDHALHLVLDTNQPLVLQGDRGFSQKHPNGGGSHYYSQPFLQASGELRIDGHRIAVQGKAWLDREWSSQFLQPDQAGWDWFALHLDSGEKLMLFRLRGAPQGGETGSTFRHGVLISPGGSKQSLDPERIEMQVLQRESVAGRMLPLEWQIRLPEIGRSMTIVALHPNQWMDVDFPYWEGVVTVNGDGKGSRGVGYLELTGYTR